MELNSLRQSDSTESVEAEEPEDIEIHADREAGAVRSEDEAAASDLRVYSGSPRELKCQCGFRESMAFVAFVAVIIALGVLAAVESPAAEAECPPTATPTTCQGDVCTRRAMAATTNQWATKAAVRILQQGGNAVDAAAAAQFALNVVQPQSTGIGGGCFFMIHKGSTGEVIALDGREEAPNAFNPSMFCKNPDCFTNASCDCSAGAWNFMPERVTGGHPVGVPGTLAAMKRALDDHGTMTLRQVMQPAIELARDGFPMYEYLQNRISENKERLALFNASAELFLSNNGEPLPLGSTFRNPDLANTFEMIADGGIDVFYNGVIAQEIVDTVRSAVNPVTGRYGVMTLADLQGYKAVYRTPTQTTYRNYTVFGFPSPGSGGLTVGMILNILENFGLSSYKPLTVEFLHKFIDAQDLGFADRNMYIGDADWVNIPSGFLDKAYARQRAGEFMRVLTAAGAPLPAGTPPGASTKYSPSPENFRHGTTHLSIMDSSGNTVSLTTTIEENLGCAVVVPGRGFLLNNELTDFDGVPNNPDTGLPSANRPEGGKRARRTAVTTCSGCAGDDTTMGGKRPRSSMSPTIITRPDVTQATQSAYMAVGSPGGSRIIGTVLNVVIGFLDLGMTLTDATDMPRVHSRNMGGAEIEEGFPSATVNELQARNFTIVNLNTTGLIHGYVQSVVRELDGQLVGKADTKRLPVALAEGI